MRRITTFFNRLWPLLFGFDFFVSYRRADAAAFAESLVAALQERGFVCFLDREETVGGVELAPALERALKRSRALIAILTPGVLESPWVISEITRFLPRRNRLIPINVGGFLSRRPANRAPFTALRELSYLDADDATIEAGVATPFILDEIGKNYDHRRVRTLARWLGVSVLLALTVGGVYVGNGYLEDRRQREIAYTDAGKAVADTKTLLRYALFAAHGFRGEAGDPTRERAIASFADPEAIAALERFDLAAPVLDSGPFIGFQPVSPPGDRRPPVTVLGAAAGQMQERFDALGRRQLSMVGTGTIDALRRVADHAFLRGLADAREKMDRYHRIEDSDRLRFVLLGNPGVATRADYVDFVQALERLDVLVGQR